MTREQYVEWKQRSRKEYEQFKKNGQPKPWWKTWKGMAIIGVAVAIFVGAKAQPPKPENESDLKLFGPGRCELEVPGHLKAPSTAKFVGRLSQRYRMDGETGLVSGEVDAQNSFGAMIRNTYVCQMKLSAGKWVVTHVVVGR